MTNLKSIAGGMAWMATSALLLLAALEPVSIHKEIATPAVTASAEAPTSQASL